MSDHLHPWVDRQGHSAFVWNVVGAIAASTERLRLGTGVTCPILRIHPAIVAHLYFHQVGPDQEGFFRFWREQLGPKLQGG